MRDKKLLFVFFFFLFLGGATFYFFGDSLSKTFFPPKDTNAPGGAIAKNEPIVTCGAGDKACAAKNEKILGNRLESPTAKFVSHQCDSPKGCPDPSEEQIQESTNAIKKYVKDSSLELIRMSGITPAGAIYFCAKDERCWSYNTKSQKVADVTTEEAPPASESANKR